MRVRHCSYCGSSYPLVRAASTGRKHPAFHTVFIDKPCPGTTIPWTGKSGVRRRLRRKARQRKRLEEMNAS